MARVRSVDGNMTTLLAVAHGTADPNGLAEIRRLVMRVRTRRPDVPVELAWLERAEPSLPMALAALTGRVVVVPLLLSTGYHVKVDITSAVAERPETVVARQLGPDDRITRVVLQRLLVDRDEAVDVVLFGAGSSDPESFQQLSAVGLQLQQWLGDRQGEPIRVLPRMLTDRAWEQGVPDEVDVASYLLAPGHFDDQLRRHGIALGAQAVAAPIGAHPAVAAVVWDRFDEAVAEPGSAVG